MGGGGGIVVENNSCGPLSWAALGCRQVTQHKCGTPAGLPISCISTRAQRRAQGEVGFLTWGNRGLQKWGTGVQEKGSTDRTISQLL